jgi:hypothetical protein
MIYLILFKNYKEIIKKLYRNYIKMDEIDINNLKEKAYLLREICSKLDLMDDIASDVIILIRSFYQYRDNQKIGNNHNQKLKNASNIVKKDRKKINKKYKINIII